MGWWFRQEGGWEKVNNNTNKKAIFLIKAASARIKIVLKREKCRGLVKIFGLVSGYVDFPSSAYSGIH